MPTLPPLSPDRSASGIITDPNTLERIVPATKRADGSLRKELRIRPGYTPQEDVSLFRARRLQQQEASALPKGHIPGWGGPRGTDAARGAPGSAGRTVPGATGTAGGGESGAAKSKAQKKNEKRKEKKKEKQDEEVRESWDASEGEDEKSKVKEAPKKQNAVKEDKGVEEITKAMEKVDI